jgi:hypothetical protein
MNQLWCAHQASILGARRNAGRGGLLARPTNDTPSPHVLARPGEPPRATCRQLRFPIVRGLRRNGRALRDRLLRLQRDPLPTRPQGPSPHPLRPASSTFLARLHPGMEIDQEDRCAKSRQGPTPAEAKTALPHPRASPRVSALGATATSQTIMPIRRTTPSTKAHSSPTLEDPLGALDHALARVLRAERRNPQYRPLSPGRVDCAPTRSGGRPLIVSTSRPVETSTTKVSHPCQLLVT